MPKSTCHNCGGKSYYWRWEDAFDKFGFGDGDGPVMTDTVAKILHEAGYIVDVNAWGIHNIIIDSIKHKGRELIPQGTNIGYDDPRDYLPEKIVRLLDAKLATDEEAGE